MGKSKPSEQQLQRKMIKYLDNRGFYVIKTIVLNRSGVPDIIVCSPTGKFIAIEVKSREWGKDTPITQLQKKQIDKINKTGGAAIAVWDFDEFLNFIKKFVDEVA